MRATFPLVLLSAGPLLVSAFSSQIDHVYSPSIAYSIAWDILPSNNSITFRISQNVTLKEPLMSVSSSVYEDLTNAFIDNGMDKRWFSLALSPKAGTMAGRDYMFVRNIYDGWSCELTDRWGAQSGHEPTLDSDLGGRDDLTYTGSQLRLINDGHTLAAECFFNRLLDTGDSKDHAVVNANMMLGWAYGAIADDGTFMKHNKTVRGQEINLFTNSRVESHRYQQLFFWHGLLMSVAFLVLMVPATILARYLKAAVPRWYFIHWKMQAASCLAIIAATIIVFVESSWTFVKNPHAIIGIILLELLVLQVVLGFLSNALWFEGKPPQIWPDKLHWWTGRLIILLGIINIFLGILEYREYNDMSGSKSGIGWDWSIAAYASIVGLIMIFCVLFELRVGQQHEHILSADGDEDLDEDTADHAAGDTSDDQHSPLIHRPDRNIVTDSEDANSPLVSGDEESDSKRRQSDYWAVGRVRSASIAFGTVLIALIVAFELAVYYA